ncbi:ADP-ribosylation factor [Strongylocentrotus purpuratus]|uniref:ADP-ribosylation factor-like protein 6 n=1 Tax=Strongylocentrotus purpuratus TaxID=7668 RepID=A0A7M7RDT7_STRPU|nr:ADP-ribosylation factor [Strongylocentrotus purpuratus]|eukprot:XP_001175949.1 PREDICTED: ADP-ribosylation factor-like [Strongylocentrotus purpuratus]
MGACISGLGPQWKDTAKTPMKILIVGLNSAGKTTILYRLMLKEHIFTTPTLGYNSETFTPIAGSTFTMLDLGDWPKLRTRDWHHHHEAEGIAFVVDSADPGSMCDARDFLFKVLKLQGLPRGIPVVVFANKQELSGACDIYQVLEKMELHSVYTNPWYLQAASAANGEGLLEGIKELGQMIQRYRQRNTLKRRRSRGSRIQ